MKISQEAFKNVIITLESNNDLICLISIMQSANKVDLSKETQKFMEYLYHRLKNITSY